jgi:adenylosuccinate lyase
MSITSISALDGRYERYVRSLSERMSEYGLIRYRIIVMTRYLEAILKSEEVSTPEVSRKVYYHLRKMRDTFSTESAEQIKAIETRGWMGIGPTNHDVKACELWIRYFLEGNGCGSVVEWIHFGCTSEDVNNIAYGMMLGEAVHKDFLPSLQKVITGLRAHARTYQHVSMLARTHGQPATPTALGKEFAVFVSRIDQQVRQLSAYRPLVKLNGASGNYNAMYVAVPGCDWRAFSRKFIRSMGRRSKISFRENLATTQIDPHDTYAELFAIMMRINTILIDFSQDMWRYISDGWIVQRVIPGETGSSTMPHKVNPIQFENAEGNLGLANALMEFCCRKLPVSRLQRDLSDSTVERAFGAIFGHCIVAYENLAGGLGKVAADERLILETLGNHWEVVTEAYQTILRSIGYPDPYTALKNLSRGQAITKEDLHDFVRGLDSSVVDEATKRRMLTITPLTYTGMAAQITGNVLAQR